MSKRQSKASKPVAMADANTQAQASLEVVNRLGLHARAAAQFVTVASGFNAQIDVVHNAQQANGKSIMGLMMLAAAKGSQLQVTATGTDAADALNALARLVQRRFGEAD